MDFGKAFTYPFQDADWAKKIIIPGLVAIIPILGGLVLIGWMLEIIRRVIQQNPTPLPELDFGKNLSDGFKGFVIGLVYGIPAIILSIPPAILNGIVANSDNSDAMSWGAVIVMFCCYGLLTLYSLLLAVVVPAAYANFVAHDSLGAAFRFSEVFALLRAAPGPYLLLLVGTILSGLIAQLGVIACVIGFFITYAYAMAVDGHLAGQAYNEATQNRSFSRAY